MSKNLLASCFIKEGVFKPKSLGGEIEITIRELTIDENENFRNILQDKEKTQQDAMYYAVSCSMVEPKFFTEDELKNINQTGLALIHEVYNELPLIGKTKKEREEYFKKIEEFMKNATKSEEKNEDDAEKK